MADTIRNWPADLRSPLNGVSSTPTRRGHSTSLGCRGGRLPCLLLGAVLGCLAVASSVSAEDRRLVILHTSEHHGQLLPIERRGEPQVGGMAARATLVAATRRQEPAMLLLDSGDILIGTATSSVFRGEPDILAMNLMGYQAMAIGNHEFDFGLDHLRRLRELAAFPFLCSNLASPSRDLPCQPSAILRAGPVTVGILGLMGRSNFPDTINRDAARLLELRDPIETARALARALKATDGVDLVIAITHEDTREDLALLEAVSEIDVIVGGHTPGFDGLRIPRSSAPVDQAAAPDRVFVKTHRQGRTVGYLELELVPNVSDSAQGRLRRAQARTLPVTGDLPPDPQVTALIQEYRTKLSRLEAQIVGRSVVTLEGGVPAIRTVETNLGNALADLVRAEYGTEIALINGGQIRDSIPPGPVNLGRVLRVLPFTSTLVTFTVTGDQLRLALENSASRLPAGDGRFLQVSGLRVVYDLSAPPGARVRDVLVGAGPLEAGRRYTVSTDAFVADGGDGYTMFAGAEDRIERQTTIRDLLLQTLKEKPLKASVDGRIVVLPPKDRLQSR